MTDMLGRKIEYARISVTDRCNLRCVYCMPEKGVDRIAHNDLLTYEEITRVVRLLAQLGVHTVRLTGGEPMARKGCLDLIGMLNDIPEIKRVAMTTNGILLKGHCAEAAAAGLKDVNISLDTTDPLAYKRLTRGGNVNDVLDTVYEALAGGLNVRLNAVTVRGQNENDICGVASLAKTLPVDVRFIEMMPVGCGAGFRPLLTCDVSRILESAFGPLLPDGRKHGMGPAVYVRPAGFSGSIGFIGAVSHAFCDSCNRVRVTPEGRLKLCLNHESGPDLRELLRGGARDDDIISVMRDAILHKPGYHGFGEAIGDRESGCMNRIGG